VLNLSLSFSQIDQLPGGGKIESHWSRLGEKAQGDWQMWRSMRLYNPVTSAASMLFSSSSLSLMMVGRWGGKKLSTETSSCSLMKACHGHSLRVCHSLNSAKCWFEKKSGDIFLDFILFSPSFPEHTHTDRRHQFIIHRMHYRPSRKRATVIVDGELWEEIAFFYLRFYSAISHRLQ
jgi:hypothetical protein